MIKSLEVAFCSQMTKVPDHLSGAKLAIRLLPPEIEESHFLSSLPPKYLSSKDGYGGLSCFQFIPGVYYHNKPKQSHHPLATLAFWRREAALAFAAEYNGHVFMNEKREKYHAVVAPAPNQRPPNFAAEKLREDVRKLKHDGSTKGGSTSGKKGKGKKGSAGTPRTAAWEENLQAKEERLSYLEERYGWERMNSNTSEASKEASPKRERQPLNGYFRPYSEEKFKENPIYHYFCAVVGPGGGEGGDKIPLKRAIRDKVPVRKLGGSEQEVDTDPKNTPLLQAMKKQSIDRRAERLRERYISNGRY